MAEPFAVGLHAIQVSQVKPNDRVLILGGGIIGMSCAEWARTFGASEITVSELNPRSGRSSGAIRWLTMWWLPTPPTWSSSCWISRGRL